MPYVSKCLHFTYATNFYVLLFELRRNVMSFMDVLCSFMPYVM